MRITVVVLLTTVSLMACGVRGRDFPPLGAITSVTLSISASDGSKYLWKISDTKQISQIIAFADARRTNWRRPWYGVSVPIVEAEFFDGENLKGSFGVGKAFFETQREDGFFSKGASSSEVSDFIHLMGVDDESLKEFTK